MNYFEKPELSIGPDKKKMNSRKKILIFGGTGYIGSAFVDLLKQNQEKYEPYLLVHRRVIYPDYEGLKLIAGDIRNFNLEWINRINPDLIVHFARIPGQKKIGRYLAAKTGAMANQRIINYLLANELSPRIIYLSGSLVYGSPGNILVDEDFSVNPASYSRQYIIAEIPWMKVLEDRSLPVSVLRPPWIIGTQSWFSSFFLNPIKKKQAIPLINDGKNWMSLITVQDCARLILHYLESGKNNEYFNMCIPGLYIQLKEFVEIISAKTSLPIRQMGVREAGKRYGQAAVQAFCTSIKLNSKHSDIYSTFDFEVKKIDQMIEMNINPL